VDGSVVDAAWLDRLLTRADLPPATGFVELGGGTFNTVLRATTAEGDVIVKVPPAGVPLMRYERGITGTEAYYYQLAAARGIRSVPRTLYHGHVDGLEALVLSVCPGTPWPEVADQLKDEDRRAVRREVGGELAALHAITGPGYGYPAAPLATTWRQAFIDMMAAVLDDSTTFGVELPREPAQVAAIIDRVSPVLDVVERPALVHFDLWDGNILVDIGEDGPRLGGLIDAERAFWGDPVAELASLRLFGDIEPDEVLADGYRAAGGRLVLDASARLRLTLYRLYLYLIMWVEYVPRRFDEGRLAWLRRMVLPPITTMLDELAHAGMAGEAAWWTRANRR
jgi:fructosamine-3-kinase